MTSKPISPDAVVVSDTSFASDDPYAIVASNIAFLNALFAAHAKSDEVSTDALRSYYVDYYLCEMYNGGLSQFVYNSRWKAQVNELVCQGLLAMSAARHLEVFQSGICLVECLEPGELDEYFASQCWGGNRTVDELDRLNKQFFQVCETENLVALNAAWLRQLPNLVVIPESDLRQVVSRRANAMPDRDERLTAARDREPRYMKLIRLLCEHAGHTLSEVTAGDQFRIHDGKNVMAWHFITDRGHFHMIDANDKAIMFRGNSTTDIVCELYVPPGMALTPPERLERRAEWDEWVDEEQDELQKFVAERFPGRKDVTLDFKELIEFTLWQKEREESGEKD